MVESSGSTSTSGTIKAESGTERRPTMIDTLGAPLLYFEAPGPIRAFDGIITIALAAVKPLPMSDGNVDLIPICVGYLKGTHAALIGLQKAIDDALLLATTTEGQAN